MLSRFPQPHEPFPSFPSSTPHPPISISYIINSDPLLFLKGQGKTKALLLLRPGINLYIRLYFWLTLGMGSTHTAKPEEDASSSHHGCQHLSVNCPSSMVLTNLRFPKSEPGFLRPPAWEPQVGTGCLYGVYCRHGISISGVRTQESAC